MQTISIIGYGKMAKAIACGLNGKFALEIIGRDKEKIQNFIQENNLLNTTSLHTEKIIDIKDKILILAIKPYALEYFKYENQSIAVFNIMAGISISKLQSILDSKSYCRVMPNVASLIGSGLSVLYSDDIKIKKLASDIFDTLGSSIFVDKEEQIDSAGAISGCGPAYLGLVAEALIDAGIKEGLNLDISTKLVNGLFDGFSKLLQVKSPNSIRLDTTSPGGTTIDGIVELENSATRAAFINAVHAAHKKAKTLS
ncbi:pyrroline-5-carboxylate reductase [Helicobacter sp. MIT 99-5507]|uniref:pyrroline-5-carboxylate reductase n=1 Tax=Helicobacter sp. MIT 99-5507 TaxID=152489 RepID=UPI000E1E8662|nr:pyrroline-5-carboxylate reductase [Helicobacter sp. MIT 99-5507]RDU57967.1 pyrroline-5-carboxylate reductase [Helicobacter sp. MIT 99-5507]